MNCCCCWEQWMEHKIPLTSPSRLVDHMENDFLFKRHRHGCMVKQFSSCPHEKVAVKTMISSLFNIQYVMMCTALHFPSSCSLINSLFHTPSSILCTTSLTFTSLYLEGMPWHISPPYPSTLTGVAKHLLYSMTPAFIPLSKLNLSSPGTKPPLPKFTPPLSWVGGRGGDVCHAYFLGDLAGTCTIWKHTKYIV